VSGSDVFEALKVSHRARRLKVFLFGGAPGVAAAAARTLNERPSGLICVGALDLGFGAVDEMSHGPNIDEVNASNGEAVSLGAKKGQLWLHHNHRRLTVGGADQFPGRDG
jgi:N-acetylglucosaminyldiphosphoundecaprenol N-acetyl-beta-D-mannosaminyltransferase